MSTVPVSAESTEVTVTGSPHFTITLVNPSSITVKPNEEFTINVTVKNDGDASGTVTLNLKDPSDTVVDSKQVTLDPNTSTTVSLSAVAPENPGQYTYRVEALNQATNSIDDQATVSVTVQQQTTTTTTTTKSSWLKWLVIGGIVVAGLLLAGRKKEE